MCVAHECVRIGNGCIVDVKGCKTDGPTDNSKQVGFLTEYTSEAKLGEENRPPPGSGGRGQSKGLGTRERQPDFGAQSVEGAGSRESGCDGLG